jgi:hypothetical protein
MKGWGAMVEARSVLLLTAVAALALIGLLLLVVTQNPVRPWPGQECRQPPVEASSDCAAAD